MCIGIVLVVVGIIALLVSLGVITGSVWSYVWPAILIIIGLCILLRKHHRHGFWRHSCCSSDKVDKQ
jgi:hypothetical protein